ncbi:MAG: hypothetical protein HFI41_02880 [Lachnospiraceae bacterium]|nr:hypothetical protein [Lachnospiraceae bacterium]
MGLYEERLNRIKTTCNLEEPDRVPIISMIQTYAVAYGNGKTQECIENKETEFSVFRKYLEDFYFDGTYLFGVNRPVKMFQMLGNSMFFVAKDGITLQHRDNCILEDDEIEEYIQDPFRFLKKIGLPRRYPELRKPFPQNLQALGAVLQEMLKFKGYTDQLPARLEKELQMPLVSPTLSEPPLDRYVGYRSFSKGMVDLRRRPEAVLRAVDATYQIVAPPPVPLPDFPFIFLPVVTTNYISRKQFEQFFWPSCKKLILQYLGLGAKVVIGFEGKCSHIYDCFLELPKGSVVALIEESDIVQAKKDIGHHVAISGGIPIRLLKNGTKQQCIDHVKRMIQECGPGGGFMLTMDKAPLSAADVNPENLRAVTEFVEMGGN